MKTLVIILKLNKNGLNKINFPSDSTYMHLLQNLRKEGYIQTHKVFLKNLKFYMTHKASFGKNRLTKKDHLFDLKPEILHVVKESIKYTVYSIFFNFEKTYDSI